MCKKIIITEEQAKVLLKQKPQVKNPLIGKRIIDFLKSNFGLSYNQLIGVASSIYQESKFSPTATNPTSSAYGICQWCAFYAGKPSRQVAMCNHTNKTYGEHYLCRRQCDPKTRYGLNEKTWPKTKQYKDLLLTPQLEWMKYELSNGYKGVITNLKLAKTPQEACSIWTKQYEQTPDVANHSQYIQLMKSIYPYKTIFQNG